MLWLIRLSSDLTTKLHNTRKRFQARLVRNLKDALDTHNVSYTFKSTWSRFFVESDDPRVPQLLEHVFGVHSYSLVHPSPLTTFEDIIAQGKAIYEDEVKGKTYAVRARRTKDIPFSAMDIQQHLGFALNEGATVDLTNPEVEVNVEVREGQVYFFSEKHPGPKGLPLNVEGRALCLMSGGFDSAVAAWMMLKRGLALDYVFFRLGGEAHERDVHQVVKVLSDHWSYGSRPRLYVIPFEDVVEQIQDHVHTRYWQLILKRQMYRVAQEVAHRCKLNTLITGEALGQVSSQTLANLEALNITDKMPILRPLIGFDKNEIVKKAFKIGTGVISEKVPEYCAIVPTRPSTGAKFQELDDQEANLKTDIAGLAEHAKRIKLRDATLTAPDPEIVTELPPEDDTVLLDIRTDTEFRRGHDDRATHLEFAYALDFYKKLDQSKHYYIYCGVGLKSANLVERMRASGYQAWVYQPEKRSDLVS